MSTRRQGARRGLPVSPTFFTPNQAHTGLTTVCPLHPPPTPRSLFARSFKANKTFILQIFFHFFLFYKNMHTYTGYGSHREDTHTFCHIHILSLSHMHTLSFLAPGLGPRSLEDLAKAAPPPPYLAPTLQPPFLPTKLVMDGAGVRVGVGDTPEREEAHGEVSDQGIPGHHTVLPRVDGGAGTIDQKHRAPEAPVCSTRALRWPT